MHLQTLSSMLRWYEKQWQILAMQCLLFRLDELKLEGPGRRSSGRRKSLLFPYELYSHITRCRIGSQRAAVAISPLYTSWKVCLQFLYKHSVHCECTAPKEIPTALATTNYFTERHVLPTDFAPFFPRDVKGLSDFLAGSFCIGHPVEEQNRLKRKMRSSIEEL